MLQKPNVLRHAVRALRDAAQAGENAAVGLARIGLAADGEALCKSEFSGDAAIHLVDFFAVTLKEV